ncbi:MAG TPA: DUF1080 domain-containing protein [Sphingomicrobium sp.]|nr:DUF1080 domain-containing protein [Sphingomicrobium sp.]
MIILAAILALAQLVRPEDTEIWAPEPPVVQPAPPSTAGPPSDAIVLLGPATELREWTSMDGGAAGWAFADGTMTVAKGTGNIKTKRKFGSYQMHLEWRIPSGITGDGQGRGNSGLFLASTGPGDAGYELQILDSYRNKTYANGQAGSVYKQHPPLVNAMRPPGEWQSYDIVWIAPIFAPDGSLRAPARLTAFHNGVLIQDNVELAGETVWQGRPRYKPHGPSPIKLQDHGDPSAPISFRNIWLRELAQQAPSNSEGAAGPAGSAPEAGSARDGSVAGTGRP